MTQRIVSLGFLAAAVVVLAQAFSIPQGNGYQAVGPRAFPLLVGVGLAVVSVIGVVQAFRPGSTPGAVAAGSVASGEDTSGEVASAAVASGEDASSEDGETHWPSVLMLLGALAAYALLLVPAGYWQATTLFFVAVARVLGSRRLVRDVLAGLVLALATYFLFDRLLGITLPPGLIRLAF